VQVAVLPVGEDHLDYAQSVFDRLKQERFRVELNAADEPLGARIRRAKLQKMPYVLVVGGDDAAAGTVGVNARGSERPERDVALDDFVARLRGEIDSHAK
jgi:threonyl-tRNA synthetase